MKSNLLKGTLILTFAGIITRILGFFYRIYLSNTLGATKLGIYQLVFPIYGICFTLYASGIQTGVSQLISSSIGNHNKLHSTLKKTIFTGLIMSLFIACTLSIIVHTYADSIATNILSAPDCAPLLRLLSYIFPFCGVTSIINGFFYGINNAKVPAITQMIEQVVRIAFVILISFSGNLVTCQIAIIALILGELASNIFNVISLIRNKYFKEKGNGRNKLCLPSLLKLSLPLSGTRLIISMLNSLETILIPSMLMQYGLTNVQALATYGILTGMALPFILFPSAITNSLSVLLLPTISNAMGENDQNRIRHTCQVAIKYTLLLGFLSMGFFLISGKHLGNWIFHNESSGIFIMILSILCPFLYCSTTLGSIINGLGKTHITFLNTVVGLSFRIAILVILTPRIGIYGYLIGLLMSQILITLLDGIYLYRLNKNFRTLI